jgi:hypothetical protein
MKKSTKILLGVGAVAAIVGVALWANSANAAQQTQLPRHRLNRPLVVAEARVGAAPAVSPQEAPKAAARIAAPAAPVAAATLATRKRR